MTSITNELFDISPVAKAIAKAIGDEKFMKKSNSAITKMIDKEPVNIDPLPELSIPEMRLYSVDDNYFESIDELLVYCRTNKISTKGLNIIDYYRSLAGRYDIIRVSNSEASMLYNAVDEDGYGLYNNERSIYRGEFIWEYHHGSIKELYKPFKERGIDFYIDIYGKIDEENQHILKYCRQNNLFNMGQKNNKRVDIHNNSAMEKFFLTFLFTLEIKLELIKVNLVQDFLNSIVLSEGLKLRNSNITR